MIAAIAVTRARRLIAPRPTPHAPTPLIVAIAVTYDLGFRAEHRSDPSRLSPAWVRPSSTNLGESAFQGNPLVCDPPELRGIDRAVRDQAHERISTRTSGNLFN